MSRLYRTARDRPIRRPKSVASAASSDSRLNCPVDAADHIGDRSLIADNLEEGWKGRRHHAMVRARTSVPRCFSFWAGSVSSGRVFFVRRKTSTGSVCHRMVGGVLAPPRG